MDLSLTEYLQNTGQRRAEEGGQKEREASASQAWASPPLLGGLQTPSQWPKRPAKGKRNSHKREVLFRPPALQRSETEECQRHFKHGALYGNRVHFQRIWLSAAGAERFISESPASSFSRHSCRAVGSSS